jgi:cyclohexanecarboxyl-CoA dehydrogenase
VRPDHDSSCRRKLAAEWLPLIVSGQGLVALALTQPSGGLDAANLALWARSTTTGYKLRGEKSSISIVPIRPMRFWYSPVSVAPKGVPAVSALFFCH